MRRFLKEHFLSIDPRTLALTRIVLALHLLIDLARRASSVSVWYTDTGLLPRFAVWTENPFAWSLFWKVESTGEAALAFTGIALAYLALLVGIWTKVAQALALVSILSLQHRVHPLTSGGDIVTCLLCWWTLPLPLGRRFSVDAWLARRKARRTGAASRPPTGSELVASIAVFGAVLQLAVIYLFNAVHKDGLSWQTGTAVHYVLWLDRVNTPIAAWARGFLPLWLLRGLTWGTIAVEAILPLLILSPFGKPWTRRLAIFLIVSLHVGISTFMNVGPFSLAMITLSTLLVSKEDWDALERRFGAIGTGSAPESVSYLHNLRHVPTLAGEIGTLALLFATGYQVLMQNRAVPALIKPAPSPRMDQIGNAARLGQSWGMFTPDVGTDEMALVIDAITVDGRRVDPYNEVAVGRSNPWLRDVPSQIGYDVLFHHYVLRMPPNKGLHPALGYWIQAYHERTGNPRDRIVSYHVYVIGRRSPLPGDHEPWPPVVSELMSSSN